MNQQAALTAEELKQITEENIGVIELSDDMLHIVSGGLRNPETTWVDSCHLRPGQMCP